MKSFFHQLTTAGCLLWLATLASCGMIDEDLSACGCDEQLTVDYTVRLVTNITTELDAKLPMETDPVLHQALRRHLSGIFTDYAHDVSLSFYDTAGDSVLLHNEDHVMDASQRNFTLQLPSRQYMHLALANLVGNSVVSHESVYYCHLSRLWQTRGDTVASHDTGLFTARQMMAVTEGEDHTFHVNLYMANCAAALVLNPKGIDASRIRVVSTGFASRFDVADSAYVFAPRAPIVLTDRVEADGVGELCYCSVSFPSRESKPTARTVVDSSDPFVAGASDETFWQFRVYVTNPDGKVTENVLAVKEPLRAGQLTVIRAELKDEGKVETDDRIVGVSVTLDWNEGMSQDVPLG